MTSESLFRWSPILPGWLTFLLLTGLVAAIVVSTVLLLRRGVVRHWLIALTAGRVACLVVFALILLQPKLTWSRTETELSELLVLHDRSGSMGLPSNSANITRWQETTAWLDSGPLASELRNRFRLNPYNFAASAEPADADSKKPEGPTRLADSLEAACLYHTALGKRVDRVLLVSDGCDHGLSDALATARNLGVRIDVLPPTAAARTGDDPVELADVQGTRRVLLGSETHFRVHLRRARPGDDRKVTVRFAENGKPLSDLPLTLKAGQAEQTFFVPYRPESVGQKTYEFAVAGSSAKPLQRSLDVVDKNFEVLILEDTWRWEYKYLHRLFEDDPSFRFTALLARGNNSFVQFASPDRRVNLAGFPQNQSELERFDMFFVGDVNPSRWPAGLSAALSRLVTQDGKSLVVIAGPHLGQLANMPELHKLLPVELDAASATPVEGPIDIKRRSEASASPFFFQLAGEARLPPVDRVYPAIRKRAGATVLLEADGKRNTFGNLIVLAEQTAGRGRVLFVGTDTLWKWHTLAASADGPTPYAIFWQQAFRALTPQRTNVQGTQLWLTLGRSRVGVQQPVVVEAEVQSGRPLPRSLVQATVTLPNQSRLPLLFTADPADPQRFRAEFASPSQGTHTIAAQLLVDNQPAADTSVTLQVDDTTDEASDTDIDLAALTRLAQGTGGQVIDPANADTWPQPTDQTDRTVQRVRSFDLWNSFFLLLVLTALLSFDWFVRVFKGFV